MADGVNTSVHQMKTTAVESAIDRVLSQSPRLQLTPSDHPVLPFSEVRDPLIISTRLL